jgi:hypothetical protein
VGIPYDQLPEAIKRLIVDDSPAALSSIKPLLRPTMKERELHQHVHNWLYKERIYFVTSRMDKRTTQRKGVPDFVCCVKGRFVAIELKVPGQKQTEEQVKEMKDVMDCEGLFCLAYSLDEVIKVINEIRK